MKDESSETSPFKSIPNLSLEKTEQLHSCHAAILQSMAVLPQEQLQNAIQRDFQFWTSTGQTVTAELLTPILQTIVEQAKLVTGAEMAALGIVKSPFESFRPWVFSGIPPEIAKKLGTGPRPIGTLGAVANLGKTIRIADIKKHPDFIKLPAHHPDLTSFLAVPIRYGQLNLGNLYLANKKKEAEFTADDQHAVEIISELASSALQQAYFHSIYQLQESQMASILDITTVGILFFNTQKQNLVANASMRNIFGRIFDKTDDYKIFLGLLSHPDGRPLSESDLPLDKALRGEPSLPMEMLVTRTDGKQIPVITTFAPVRGLQNQISGGAVMFENIADRRELDQLRQDFTAMLAHDVKNPANITLMNTQMILQSKPQEEITVSRSFLKLIEKNTKQIMEMVDNFLMASKLEGNFSLKLNLKPMNLFEATKLVLKYILPKYDEHELILNCNSELPLTNIDIARYEEILLNLISNAAKYSKPNTPIEISFSPSIQSHQGSNQKGVLMSVKDQGIGISEKDLNFIFNRYYRTQEAAKFNRGFGLGLFITKGLINAHGGSISVESKLGQGTTFSLWFPAL